MSCEHPMHVHRHTWTGRHSHMHSDNSGHSSSVSAWWAFQSCQHGKGERTAVLYSKVQRTGFLCRSTREHHLPKEVSSSSHRWKGIWEKTVLHSAIFSGHLPGVFIRSQCTCPNAIFPQSFSMWWNISHTSNSRTWHSSAPSLSLVWQVPWKWQW